MAINYSIVAMKNPQRSYPVRRWILLNKELQKRLEELHYQKGQRTLTPLQHEAICHYLGEP